LLELLRSPGLLRSLGLSSLPGLSRLLGLSGVVRLMLDPESIVGSMPLIGPLIPALAVSLIIEKNIDRRWISGGVAVAALCPVIKPLLLERPAHDLVHGAPHPFGLVC